MRRPAAVWIFFLLIWMTSCEVLKPAKTPVPPGYEPTLILISFDGCRYDYPDSTDTPGLDEMERNGIRAEGLQTVFPSKTFPNHLSIVTGLYPEHHGIISNRIYDPRSGEWYKLNNDAPAQSKWYHGEPIWVTAERQGLRTATFFWPGSEAEIAGYRPTYWKPYDESVPFAERVNQVLKWLDLPKKDRPRFISLYFHEPDHTGHELGPNAPETKTAMRRVDSQLVALIEGIKKRHLENVVNLLVVSDHGMTQLSRDSVIFLDDYINTYDVQMTDWSPVAGIRPFPNREDAVYLALKNAHPKMRVYRKEEIPDSLHYRDNAFIPPIIAIADLHWTITSHDYFKKNKKVATGGTHGYDPAYREMNGICYAMGPAFKKHYKAGVIRNINLYELMCRILGITPAQNDGNPAATLDWLRKN